MAEKEGKRKSAAAILDLTHRRRCAIVASYKQLVGQVPDLPSANFDRRIDEKPSGISIVG
jgi:hypothetical protein